MADRARLLTVRSAGDAHAPVGGPPALIADDQRYTLRQAAHLTGKSVDTLRRWIESAKLPGADEDPADPTGTIYIPASALLAALPPRCPLHRRAGRSGVPPVASRGRRGLVLVEPTSDGAVRQGGVSTARVVERHVHGPLARRAVRWLGEWPVPALIGEPLPRELLRRLPAGRSVAALRVERAGVTALAEIDEVLCCADDPDVEGHAAWSAARRQEWLAAGVSVDDDAAVVWVRFHVLGRDQGPG